MARYIERSRHDWWATAWKLLLFLGLVAFAIAVVYPWRGLLPTVLMILVSLWIMVRLMSQSTAYKCGKCGKVFQVPTTVNFFTMSSMGKNPDGTYYAAKVLTCPRCGKRSKARLLKRIELKAARAGGKLLK